MAEKPTAARSFQALVTLGTLAIVIVGLSLAERVLIPLALAVLFTFILMPVVEGLERRGLRRVSAVLASVLLAFALMAVVGWVIILQLGDLAGNLPRHTDAITGKIETLQGAGPGVTGNLSQTWKQVSRAVERLMHSERDVTRPRPQQVEIVTPGLEWFPKVVGPVLEILATAIVIVILVIFMLIKREDLRNRLIRLVGRGQLTVTTRALDEAAQRISGFLLMQSAVNLGFGAAVGVGMFVLGLVLNPDQPSYAVLWGVLAGLLRFIPYIGVWVAAGLMSLYNVAVAPNWTLPLVALGYIVVLELIAANVIEPLLFSHSTGVSAVALLVAVVFWTWLWGPIGLLLSTPLTSCLAVLGRYVPPLEFFDVLLGDEPALEPEVAYYQRLLARDQDEATDLVEERLKTEPLDSVYDRLLLPALLMTRRDRAKEALTAEDEQFVFRVTRDVIEDLVFHYQQLKLIASGALPAGDDAATRPRALVLGCPARDEADEIALAMFQQMMEPSAMEVDVVSPKALSSEVVGQIREKEAGLVVIASLPPGGLAQARYLCKRLRSQFPGLKILVGRWGQKEDVEKTQRGLRAAGADFVGMTLVETRNQLLPLVSVAAAPQPAAH